MGIEVDNHLWCAVAGASYARQVHDYMAEGRGVPDERQCDRMLEEAEAIADDAIEARIRASARRKARRT